VRDEDSPLMRIAPGSTITLHEALTVPAGHARVFMQNGKVRAKTRLDRYRPHCNFEVRSVSDGSLRIEPDTFVVTKIIEDEEEVVSRQQPLRLAGWEMTGGDALPMVTRLVRHRLHSQRQPQVMRLTCHGGFDDPWEVDYPSISEIRRALGERATLKLAAGA
jgi:hypothetical protein